MTQKRTQKIIVIVGPTASGKSEFAVRIAKRFGGEIISADSRQVYRGLNLGAGKVPGKWRRGVFLYKDIPHHCIDIASPKKTFTAADFKRCADRAITDIIRRGHAPVLVGGTGFYIDAVVDGIAFPPVPPNNPLRRRLGKKTAAELSALLRRIDPKRAETLDKKNPRRIIRAIEVAKALGRVPPIERSHPYPACWIGISIPRRALDIRIEKRLLARMRAGMIREAKKLHAGGLSWKRFRELGLEYRYLAEYLQGRIQKNELHKALLRAIRQYARRQMTWFRRNERIYWLTRNAGNRRIARHIRACLTSVRP